MNVVQALAIGLGDPSHGHAAVRNLELVATTYVDRRRPSAVGSADELPGNRVLVPHDHRSLRRPENTLLGAKRHLLRTIERSVARHGVGFDRGRRVDRAALDEVAKKARSGTLFIKAQDELSKAAEAIAWDVLEYIWSTGALDALVDTSPTSNNANVVECVIHHLLGRGSANPEQLGRAVVYALGVAWNEAKNFFAEFY